MFLGIMIGTFIFIIIGIASCIGIGNIVDTNTISVREKDNNKK